VEKRDGQRVDHPAALVTVSRAVPLEGLRRRLGDAALGHEPAQGLRGALRHHVVSK